MDNLEEFFLKVQNSQVKQQEELRQEALDEMVGFYRRIWRELRAALTDEGVPTDLVDEATLQFIKMATVGK